MKTRFLYFIPLALILLTACRPVDGEPTADPKNAMEVTMVTIIPAGNTASFLMGSPLVATGWSQERWETRPTLPRRPRPRRACPTSRH